MPANDAAFYRYINVQIRQARIRSKITQRQLAQRTGIDLRHIKEIEAHHGIVAVEWPTILKIAQATRQPVTFFAPPLHLWSTP